MRWRRAATVTKKEVSGEEKLRTGTTWVGGSGGHGGGRPATKLLTHGKHFRQTGRLYIENGLGGRKWGTRRRAGVYR